MLWQWWEKAEGSPRAWRGACERCEAFTRVGVRRCGQWCPGSDKGLG